MDPKFVYANNTGADVSDFHDDIMAAIRDGHFCEELADIFVLTKTPPGSAAEYVLDFVGE